MENLSAYTRVTSPSNVGDHEDLEVQLQSLDCLFRNQESLKYGGHGELRAKFTELFGKRHCTHLVSDVYDTTTLMALAILNFFKEKNNITAIAPLKKLLELNPDNELAGTLLSKITSPYRINSVRNTWEEIREAYGIIVKAEELEISVIPTFNPSQIGQELMQLQGILKDKFDINKIFSPVSLGRLLSVYLRMASDEHEVLELIKFFNGVLDQGIKVRNLIAETTDFAFLQDYYHDCINLSNLHKETLDHLSKLMDRVEDLDGDFTPEYIHRLTLGNLLGIGSFSILGSNKFSLSGWPERLVYENFFKYRANREVAVIIRNILANFFKSALVGKYAEVLKKCQSYFERDSSHYRNDMCITKMDKETHHVSSLVRMGNYLALSNQFFFVGSFIFKINGEKFNPEEVEKLQWFDCLEKEDQDRFIHQDYLKGLEADLLWGIEYKSQKVPNCYWKAVQLNVFSTLLLAAVGENLNPNGQLVKDCRALTRLICREIKASKIFSYIFFHHDDKAYAPEPAIMVKAKSFAIKTKNQSLLNEIERMRMISPQFAIE